MNALGPCAFNIPNSTEEFCRKCGRKFLVWPTRWPEEPQMCERCHSMVKLFQDNRDLAEARKQDDRERRAHEWLELCPDQYRENETSKINENCYHSVISWKINPRGLYLAGPSQRGKTTSCWRLLEKLFVGDGIRFMAFTESEFHQMALSKTNQARKEWLDSLCRIPVLFLDDFGHSPAYTKDLEHVLYVIENRTSWKKPILATTQFTSDELERRSNFSGGEKTVVAILNRLRSACDLVDFNAV